MTTDPRRKVYEDVGVRPVINCTGHGTIVGGATISPTAWETMANANHYYVDMRELFHSTGEIIAPPGAGRGGIRDLGRRRGT